MQSKPNPLLSPDLSDAELARRVSASQPGAFELLMRRYNQALFRTARSILRNDNEAEEALQEAYLRAWRAMGSFRNEARLSTWLARIVINEALARLRRRGNVPRRQHRRQNRHRANRAPSPVHTLSSCPAQPAKAMLPGFVADVHGASPKKS